jgi:hypothetical protein
MKNKLHEYKTKIKDCNQAQSELNLAFKTDLEESILNWDEKNIVSSLFSHWFLSRPIKKALEENELSYKKERHRRKRSI